MHQKYDSKLLKSKHSSTDTADQISACKITLSVWWKEESVEKTEHGFGCHVSFYKTSVEF